VSVHAIEITLTRSIEAVELKAAQQESALPMAAADDRKRLVVLVTAKNESRAIRKIWKRLEDTLPIDVLCSLFPGTDGKYLMSIPLGEDVQERLRQHAAAERTTPEEYLERAIAQALALERSTRRAKLECSLSELLRTYDPEEIAGAAARRVRP
jgi:hypothetical protein